MNTYYLKIEVFIISLIVLLCFSCEMHGQATQTQNGTLFTQNALYYSAQSKQSSSFTGQLTITKSDAFECGSASFSQEGPITVTIDKALSYTCGEPMSDTWNGKIAVDQTKAPEPGKVADASITANATYYYSKPCGNTPCGVSNPCCTNTPISGMADKIAISSGYPNSWNVGTADSPRYHGWAAGNKTEKAKMKVYSIKVEIKSPERIITNDSATFTAIPFPETGGKFLWSTGDTTQSITLLVDKAMTLTVTYTIMAVSYMASADVCALKSETVATSPKERDRTKIGVGEEVKVTYTPESAAWTATGSGSLSKEKGATITYTAGEKKEDIVITAEGKGGKCEIGFRVVEPDRFSMERKAGTNIKHTDKRPDCGWIGKAYVHPDDVNFYRIEVREKDSKAVTTGAYDVFAGVMHGNYAPPDNASVWLTAVSHSPAKGTGIGMVDTIYSGDPGVDATGAKPPFKAGTMTFPIVWQWHVVGKKTISNFPGIDQEHEIFGDTGDKDKKDKDKDKKGKEGDKKDKDKEKEYENKKNDGRCESRKGGIMEATKWNDKASTY